LNRPHLSATLIPSCWKPIPVSLSIVVARPLHFPFSVFVCRPRHTYILMMPHPLFLRTLRRPHLRGPLPSALGPWPPPLDANPPFLDGPTRRPKAWPMKPARRLFPVVPIPTPSIFFICSAIHEYGREACPSPRCCGRQPIVTTQTNPATQLRNLALSGGPLHPSLSLLPNCRRCPSTALVPCRFSLRFASRCPPSPRKILDVSPTNLLRRITTCPSPVLPNQPQSSLLPYLSFSHCPRFFLPRLWQLYKGSCATRT